MSMSHHRRFFAAFALPTLFGVIGCGDGDGLPRRAVSGTVTLDGQPLDGGRIEFRPIGDGVATGSAIARGAYRIARDDGPTPGRYRVNISSPVESGAAPEPEESAPGRGRAGATERIPARYNASSTLTVEIKPGATDPIDFSLEFPPTKNRKP